MNNYVDLIVAICGAISVIVPLAIKLYNTFKALVKEKNYAAIIKAIKPFASEAEKLFTDGADRKAYVLEKVQEMCKELNVEYDAYKFNEEITELIDATKNINVKKK